MPSQVPKAKPLTKPSDDDNDGLFSDPHPSSSSSSTKPVSSLSPSAAQPTKVESKNKIPTTTARPKNKESHDILFGSSPEAVKSESDDDLFSSSTSTSKSGPAAANAKPAVPVACTTVKKEAKKPAKIGGGRSMFGGSDDDDDDLFSEPKSRKSRTPDSEKPVSVKTEPSSTSSTMSKKKPIGGVSVFGGSDPFGAAAAAAVDKKETAVKAPTASSPSLIALKQEELRAAGRGSEEDLFSSKKPTVSNE